MFNKSRAPLLVINRSTLLAATPIFFLLLLGLWTVFNVNLRAVKAQPFSNSVFALVKRNSANLREGPGTQYRILGQSLKGASLPVVGEFDNEFGQRWYEVYLRAFGNVWVSGTVVSVSPSNADIPAVNPSQADQTASTLIATVEVTIPPSNNKSNPNNPTVPPSAPTNVPQATQPPAPTSAPPPPATTPDVNG